MVASANLCRFKPAAGGLTDFVYSASVAGYDVPATAAVDGTTYYWRAESDDQSQWELFQGKWTLGTLTASRTTTIRSSSGTSPVNFSTVPTIGIVHAAADFGYIRERLTANRTYYIRSDGSNSNDGLADTAGGAFLTIQKFIDTIARTIDLGGFNVTGQVRTGTFAAGTVSGPWVGVGTVTLTGDTATPANVVINSGGFIVTNGGYLTLSGFKTSDASQSHITAAADSVVNFSAWEFGLCTSGKHINADTGAKILGSLASAYTISGNAQSHIRCQGEAYVNIFGGTATLSGTPAFSQGFVVALQGGEVFIDTVTWSGSATGARFSVASEGIIDTVGTKLGLNALPGNAVGTISIGGSYMGLTVAREVVTSNRTYFIRSDGSNSNDGLVDSAAGAFLTIQKFFDTVAALDMRAIVTGNITVAGTYAGAVAKGPWIGSNYSVVLNGDSGTPSNILINSTGFTAQGGAQFTIQGMKTSGLFDHLYAKDPGSHISFTGNWEFATCTGKRNMFAELGGKITYASGSTISAAAANHMLAGNGGTIKVSAATVTLTGTPNFTVAFAQASGGEIITASQTFSGSATGVKFAIDSGGKISRGTGTINLNYFPGDTVGTIAEGWYQGIRYDPLNSQSAAYTTTATDMNAVVLHPTADTTARTFTIDSNANVPYPLGTKILFINQSGAGNLTIAITSDTLRLIGPGTTGSQVLKPNTSALATKVGTTEWLINIPTAIIRERLTATRTYFIRSDGSDSNDGLTDSAGGGFLTIQKFFDTLAGLDIATFAVTGQVRTGTFAGATMSGPALGSGAVTLQGDTTTPANCILSSALNFTNGSIITAKGFKSTSSGDGIFSTSNSVVTFAEWDFGVCTGNHLSASFVGAIFNTTTNYTISGSAATHVTTTFNGLIRIQNQTVTLTGTPAITTFINCANNSYGHVFPTFSGTSTGSKFNVNNGSQIIASGGGFNFYPGSTPGTISNGGAYNGITPGAINSQSAAYTTVTSDANNTILHPSADTTARTFTIDSNANVPYPLNTKITFVNQNAAGALTIAITTDTMRLSPGGTTGSRTLAANGVAIAHKITTTEWIIYGFNLT